MEDHGPMTMTPRIPEGVSKFDNQIFLVNPNRAMFLGQLLGYFPDHTSLRERVYLAIQGGAPFWTVADAYGLACGKDHEALGKSRLPKDINDLMDSLRDNTDISFSTNELQEIRAAIDATFTVPEAPKLISGIRGRFKRAVGG